MLLMMVGDLILDEPHADRFFEASVSTLTQADVLCGHVEVPHTSRGEPSTSYVPAPPSDPANLAALQRAGFSAVTLAGNHVSDAGRVGVADTLGTLASHGIATCGSGMTLAAAREPVVIESKGLRIGFLSYNCVGPREAWAGSEKAGCAYVRVLTHYELEHATPGGPPTVYTFADPASLAEMRKDIEALRARVDLLAVSLHKGLGHTPARLAMYERPVAHEAIDAGADVVIGHHAHILQGIEIYRGKPIFHGLGNFVTVTRALAVEGNASPERLKWAQQRRALFGFEPDPLYPTYPFHPEAKNAMIAWLEADESGVRRAGFYPCWIRPDGTPEVLGRGEQGEAVKNYVEKISLACDLNPNFSWQDNRVTVLEI